MRVHSPVVGVCDPSLTCRHWALFESPVGSAALQVGDSIWLVCKLISQPCSTGALSLFNLPAVFLSHCISCYEHNANKKPTKTRLPKRLMLVRIKTRKDLYKQYHISNSPTVNCNWKKNGKIKKKSEFTTTCDVNHKFTASLSHLGTIPGNGAI